MNHQLEITTDDALLLSISSEGKLQGLKTNGKDVLSSGARSGFWIRDVVTGEIAHVLGHVEERARGVSFSGEADQFSLRISAHFIPFDDYIRITGYVENSTTSDRAVDVEFRLYCEGVGAQWFRDVQVSSPIESGRPPLGNDIYPFHGLVTPEGKGAFGLAVAPEEPAIFEFAYENNAYYTLKLRYGLSEHASGRLYKRANFEILLYRVEAEWGFRSVVQRYYNINHQWFRRRATRNGMWLHNFHAEKVPNPWDYAYRVEVHGPGGQGWEHDARQGIPTLEYLLTGQLELRHLAQMPEAYEDQLRELQNSDQIYNRNIAPDSIYQHEQLEGEVILNCGLFDGRDRYRILPRETDWGGPSLTFPMNPDPGLYFDRPIPTIGKITMEWVRWLFAECPFLNGLFVDSLFGWGRYFNCRSDHFTYARISLTYDPESKKPAIANKFANQEFLYALREVLHPDGRLLMGNGPRPGRFFNGMALDILGSENTLRSRLESPDMGGEAKGGGQRTSVGLLDNQYSILLFDRIVAYQKPHLILNFDKNEWLDDSIVRRFWEVGLFFGVYPGYRQLFAGEAWTYDAELWEKHQQIVNCYSPLLQQITAAGWEPITFAKTDNPSVWIERYGNEESELYFTLMNISDEDQSASVSIQVEPLHLSNGFQCVELIELKKPVVKGTEIYFSFKGNETKLIRIK